MRYKNYALNVHIVGEGRSGKAMNSLAEFKIGVEDEDYVPEEIVDFREGTIKLFGDKFSLDHIRCGKDYEKYFRISQEMNDGWLTITFKNLSPFAISLKDKGWSSESKDQK